MSKTNQAVIIIPARYDSTRFPGKPLALIHGMTMLERVWRIARRCHAEEVFIATDSDVIAEHAASFNAKIILTSPECPTGTDRVAEAATKIAADNSIVISLQGDAVLTPPWIIDDVIQVMKNDPEIPLATPAVKLSGQALQDFLNHKKVSPSSGTTVTFDKNGNALYFSKQTIPFYRDALDPKAYVYRHIGLYGYRSKTLQHLQSLPQSEFEKIEKLEQLRALENNIAIRIVAVDYQGRSHGSVDTPHDVAVVESIIATEGELIS